MGFLTTVAQAWVPDSQNLKKKLRPLNELKKVRKRLKIDNIYESTLIRISSKQRVEDCPREYGRRLPDPVFAKCK